MVAYMWNTDRNAVFVRVIDAPDMVASPEPAMQAADPEHDSELPADPEPVFPDTMGPGDYEEARARTKTKPLLLVSVRFSRSVSRFPASVYRLPCNHPQD